ncbi:MAG: 30S ribosomal protein S12 methylthiotransferase RimO [Phycisphaerales bacterium]|nr:30S ribosomal protein S12 methylthiotransferase RimO [Phycisphaerales bacterium]
MTTPTIQSPIRTVALVSLGCPKNLVDSEKMLGLLAEAGLIPTDDHDSADAIVINTCGFLEAAKVESMDAINEAVERKRHGAVQRVVVAGCLVQRHRARLLDWQPGIDAIVGVFDRDRIVQAVRGDGSQRDGPDRWIARSALQAAKVRGRDVTGLTIHGKRGIGYYESDDARLRLTPRHWAYLRISEGCNRNCAFCTIPAIRGAMRSKPLDAVIAEARELIDDGAFELNLIGQDTTAYGADIGDDAGLPGLLRAVNEILEPIHGWGRLMYAYPSSLTDEMIDTIASLPNIVKYVDIPLQHISDRVLTAMRRNTSRTAIEVLLEKLRDRVPGIAIRTTLITGFPGETDDDHRTLIEFVRSFGFEMMGVFIHSPEQGTLSGGMEDDPDLAVPEDVKQARYDELMQAQQSIAFDQAAFIASQYDEHGMDGAVHLDVLIDSETPTPATTTEDDARIYVGRAYHQAPQVDSVTYVHSGEPLSPGELVRTVITGSDGYDLVGHPQRDMERAGVLPILP